MSPYTIPSAARLSNRILERLVLEAGDPLITKGALVDVYVARVGIECQSEPSRSCVPATEAVTRPRQQIIIPIVSILGPMCGENLPKRAMQEIADPNRNPINPIPAIRSPILRLRREVSVTFPSIFLGYVVKISLLAEEDSMRWQEGQRAYLLGMAKE